MEHETDAAALQLDTDTPCIECGYDLAGLSAAGVCPECAAPVTNTLRGGLLRFSDPQHLKRLQRGAALTLLGCFGAAVMGIASGMAEGAGAAAGVEIAMLAISLCAIGAMLLGWWWLTSADPASIQRDRLKASRMSVRISVLVMIVLGVIGIPFVVGASLLSEPLLGDILLVLASIALLGATFVQFLAMCFSIWHVRGLSARFPDSKLRGRAGITLRLLALSIILMLSGLLAAMVGVFVGLTVVMAGALALLVSIIMYLLTIERARSLLAKTLRQATASPIGVGA